MMPSSSTASSRVPLTEGEERERCHISGVSLSAGSTLLLPPSLLYQGSNAPPTPTHRHGDDTPPLDGYPGREKFSPLDTRKI